MLVSDIGPRDAKIMFVGEAPGEEEERFGQPFVGSAGRLLKQMCGHVGIDWPKCYVTNVMNVRPPGNDFSYFYNGNMPSQQLEEGWRLLQQKVETIKPDVVILLGAEPLKALCNKEGISSWRGCWTSFRSINVMPTYHPSYILRVYGDHPIVEMDLTKAITQRPEKPCEIITMPSLSSVISWLSKLVEHSNLRVGFDIETIQKSIRSIGFAYGYTCIDQLQGGACFNNAKAVSAISIPFMKVSAGDMARTSVGSTRVILPSRGSTVCSCWNVDEEVTILDAIDSLLQSGIQLVGHNSISFDAPLIRSEFSLTIKNHYMDTMHAWHCLCPELPMGLDFLCSVLTNYPNYWTDRNRSSDQADAEYNAMDCIVTLESSYKIEQELNEAELPKNSRAV